MSRTERIYKGKKYRQSRERKRVPDRKHFGNTSGQHSRGVYEVEIIEGHVVYTKTDRATIKDEDFIKYGWPFDRRNKKMIERMRERNEKETQ